MNCRFLGWQDTVRVECARQYFRDCRIQSHCDYIYCNERPLISPQGRSLAGRQNKQYPPAHHATVTGKAGWGAGFAACLKDDPAHLHQFEKHAISNE